MSASRSRGAFGFASRHEEWCMILSCILHILRGAIRPFSNLLLGHAIVAIEAKDLYLLNRMVHYYGIISCTGFIISALGTYLAEYTAEAQIERLKGAYLTSIIRQDVGFFDSNDPGELSAGLEQACVKIRDGIGYKFAMIFCCISEFLLAYGISLFYSWRVTLLMSTVVPISVSSLIIFEKVMKVMSERSDDAVRYASTIIEEAIPAIRTIASFGLEAQFCERFNDRIRKALKVDLRLNTYLSAIAAVMMSAPFFGVALGLWYGARIVRSALISSDGSDMDTPGRIVITYKCVNVSSQSLGAVFNFINGYGRARGSLKALISLIERKPTIHIDDDGHKLSDVKGSISFKNVHFTYPTRPDNAVFAGIDIEIEAGEVVALVGPSGCGKSTIVQLIQRFYDADSGTIEVDGKDIKGLSLKWMREQMALVAQEPRLFCDTIEGNIRCGYHGDVSMERVREVARLANADSFIKQLPQGYATNVGLGGSLLSGGQKQRIAIARAMLRDPKILILDEATSALDNESEKIVQQALDELVKSKRRTTIIIAHRLSTIRAADKIIVLDSSTGSGSRVVECGTHEVLMKLEKGIYRRLVEAQTLKEPEPKNVDRTDQNFADGGGGGGLEYTKPLHRGGSRTLRVRKGSRESRMSRGESISRHMSIALDGTPMEVAKVDETHLDVLRSSKIRKLLKMERKEWYLLLMGCTGSLVAGCINPSYATLTATFASNFYNYDTFLTPVDNGDEIVRSSNKTAAISLVVACVGASFIFVQWQGWCRASELNVNRIRELLFRKLMFQGMEYFDDPLNNTGRLNSIIVADTALTRGITGSNLSLMTQYTATVISAFILAYGGNWKLTTVALAINMLILPAFVIQMRCTKAIRSSVADGKPAAETPEFYMNECVSNLRTIAAYGLQDKMLSKYNKALAVERNRGNHNAWVTAIANGFAVALTSTANCITFFYTLRLLETTSPFDLEKNQLTLEKILRSVYVPVAASIAISNTLVWTSDFRKAKAACINIFCVLEKPSAQDSRDPTGDATTLISGHTQLNSALFRYPHRPNQPILGGVTFEIQEGQTIALVGASGSGKSTIVELLERFYDLQPTQDLRFTVRHHPDFFDQISNVSDFYGGEILLNGKSIYDYNLRHLRSQIGLVGQEPVLFDMSIRENIANGRLGCCDEDVIAAAKKANAHDFITALPEGYETNVGRGGGQMSGGQKQRIALARALIREPRLLLLDEATSALDPESERIVQQTIDQVLRSAEPKTTTIMIAHRLSTIRTADKIIVLSQQPGQGSIVAESGTHEELMSKEHGLYKTLANLSEVSSI